MGTIEVVNLGVMPHGITRQSLTREPLVALIATGTQPLVLSVSDLAAADLSRLDLPGV